MNESESSVRDTPAARIAMWLDLMRTTDKLLLAGLQRRIGPGGDLRRAYREWYSEQMREHDQVVERIAERLSAAPQETSHAR
jgi:hypothetical protein